MGIAVRKGAETSSPNIVQTEYLYAAFLKKHATYSIVTNPAMVR